ncbi:hypothetical protein FLAV_00871 [Flavobacteriales bacterium]|nr:hypothetical protein FLAV_00871 [Flavobacteriales bacterium]
MQIKFNIISSILKNLLYLLFVIPIGLIANDTIPQNGNDTLTVKDYFIEIVPVINQPENSADTLYDIYYKFDISGNDSNLNKIYIKLINGNLNTVVQTHTLNFAALSNSPVSFQNGGFFKKENNLIVVKMGSYMPSEFPFNMFEFEVELEDKQSNKHPKVKSKK